MENLLAFQNLILSRYQWGTCSSRQQSSNMSHGQSTILRNTKERTIDSRCIICVEQSNTVRIKLNFPEKL